MSLRGIRTLNITTTVTLCISLAIFLGAPALGAPLRTIAAMLLHPLIYLSIGLCVAVDRVNCPLCGRTFNRQPDAEAPALRAHAQIRWTCVHCGNGSE